MFCSSLQYTCSIYFLFFRVFFLVPDRPQQLGDEEFARTNEIKNGTLLKHLQISFCKRTNAEKPASEKRTSCTQIISEHGFVLPRKGRQRIKRQQTRILTILFKNTKNWKKRTTWYLSIYFNSGCTRNCFFFFLSHFFIWKASGKTRKLKRKKKKEEKSVTTVHRSGTQDSKLRGSVSFSSEKETFAKSLFYENSFAFYSNRIKALVFFLLVSGKEKSRFFNYKNSCSIR